MKRSIAFVVLFLTALGAHTYRATATVFTIPSGTWSPASDMATARAGAAATLLPDGSVLITGGIDQSAVLASAERFNPTTAQFSPTRPMSSPRVNHTATLLADGRVLVAGGTGGDAQAISTAEIFDPVLNEWQPAGSLHVARRGHTATLLVEGTVLFAGGDDNGVATATLELFDAASGSFTLIGDALSAAKTMHAAASLGDGRVLIAGGYDGVHPLATTDIYDPKSGSLSAGPNLSRARSGLTATRLLTGDALIAGGADETGELSSAEIFDPKSNTFRPAGNGLGAARQNHLAFLLPHNNAVLIVGGSASGSAVTGAEIFVPWEGPDGAFCSTPVCASGYAGPAAPTAARTWAAGSALSFPAGDTLRSGPADGLLLFAGGVGSKSAELYGFATINTDRADYPPGSTVTITGAGWQPGETVALMLVESPVYDEHPLVSVTADESGNISSTEFQPDEHDLNVRFYLTAYGSASQAQTTFTDGPADVMRFATSGLPGGVSISVAWNGFNNGNGNPTSGTVTFNSPGPSTGGQNPGVGAATAFSYTFPASVTVSGTTYQFSSGSPASPFTTDPSGGVLTTITGTYVPAISATTLTVPAAAGTYGGTATLSATLTSGGSGVSGKSIAFRLNGSLVGSAVTNGSGVATLVDASLAGINAGTYSGGVSASFAGDSSYQSASATNTLTVNKAPLTVTADNKSRPYGDPNPTLTASYSGFVNGEALATSGVTGTPGLTTAAIATSSVAGSPYAISATQGTLTANNYSFAFSNGTLTVSAAPLTVSADDASREYGDPNPAFSGTIVGLKNGDAITASYSTAATPASPVGNYDIVPAAIDATPAKLENYLVTIVNGHLTIGRRPITVTADAISKIYGELDPALTYQVTSGTLIDGDGFTGSPDRAPGESVGSYAIGQHSLTAGDNYDLHYVGASLTIDRKTAAVNPAAASKVYGAVDPTLDGTLTGFLAADHVTATYTRPAGEIVGSYVISATLAPLTVLGNYDITYGTASFTIDPKTIVGHVTVDDKTYDGGTSATISTRTLDGVVAGDDVSYVGGTASFDDRNVGSGKPVTATGLGLSGEDAANYTVNTTALTTASILARTLTITAAANARMYDGTVAASATPGVTGLQADDTVTGLSETYDNKHVGSGKTLSVSAYTVNDGNGGHNYVVLLVTNTSGVITKAPLAIAAQPNTKIYDGTTTSAAIPHVTGLLTGDTVSGLAQAYDDANAGTGKTLSVSSYTIDDGNGGGNYDVDRIARFDGVIAKAEQSIAWANPSSMLYGTPLGGAQLNATVTGIQGGSAPGALTYAPGAGTVLPAGANTLHVAAAATVNYNAAQKEVPVTVAYSLDGCLGTIGHGILPPLSANGSSVFKQGSTVPAKFRVCDANGNSVGGAGVVQQFNLIQRINGTLTATVNEAVDSTTPDTAFRWDASDRQWIFNINTKGYAKNVTYVFRIVLNDGSTIDFLFGLK